MSLLFALAAQGAGHLASMALHLAANVHATIASKAPVARPQPAAPVRKAAMSMPQVRSEGAVTLAQGWWDRPRRSEWYRREQDRDWWWSDDDDDGGDYREGEAGARGGGYETYRTLCVRLCDGFYWPISYATTPEFFERDERKCRSSCGSPVRLYKYRNPGGGTPDDMEDLSGQPYSRLKTAFLYRTQYNASCKCKADPWQQEALDRHRLYALQAAKRKGDKVAAQELEQLKARVNAAQAERTKASGGTAADTIAEASASQPLKEGTRGSAPERSERMSLGRRAEPERSRPSVAPARFWRNSADNAP